MALFFLARVELHGATRGEYEPLHVAMSRSGFRRDVVTGTGNRLMLPPAEYAYFGGSSSAAVLEIAQTTVRGVWAAGFEILVSEVASWWSVGLRQTGS